MKKRKAFAIKPASSPNGEINVTPLVDVVLVLLIIFMVVTPLLEKDIPIALPSTEKVEEVKDVPPDQLVVKLAADGTMKVNAEDVANQEELISKLKARLEPKSPTDKVVFVIADDGANYAKLVSILDGARLAGAQKLGMATDNPDKP